MHDARAFPVARIGIVGGGQLGRMLVMAAQRLGCSCIVLDPTPGSPAGQVAGHQIVGNFHDPAKLRELVESSDVTTFELEDIGTGTLQALVDEGHTVQPSPALLATIQDKLLQKQLMHEHGIPTADFRAAESPDAADFAEFGYPLVQKARRGGYDGRGVAVLNTANDFAQHLPVPSYVERFITADKELAVIVARATDGDCRCYPVVEMVFRPGENVLDLLLAPADIDPALAAQAESLARQTVESFQGVGIFGVEMFVTETGALLVNEVAPRTHNSGHYTIEACVTDQFEQHLRAILGLPLGSTQLLSPAAMVNILGDAKGNGRAVVHGLSDVMAIPGLGLHLYGKTTTKPFRKMGHLTVLDDDIDVARAKAVQARDALIITGED